MLKKKERLSRTEFSRFFSFGKRHHSTYLTLVYAPHDAFHASVVVSKKVARSAVARNKIRRRIYDIVRQYKKEHQKTGVCIFLVKKGASALPYSALKEDVRALLARAT